MPWMTWGFFGMHLFWWIFWILVLIALFSFPGPVARNVALSETPLEILQRRYANGEIATAEFDERKARLTEDRSAA